MEHTIPAAFAAAVRRDPAAPLLTYYDDATGERTELSGVTLDNWVAKTANLCVDAAGLDPGDTVAVLLPPHWQTAAVLLGCWSAGLAVDTGGQPHRVEAQFADVGAAAAAQGWPVAVQRWVTGLLPLAAPLRVVPPGFADYVVDVRPQGDRFTPVQPVDGADPAWAGPERTHADAVRAAAARAAELGVGPGDRVLIDAGAYPDPRDWLLAPLVAGASVVLCARPDRAGLAGRAAAERVSVTL